MLLHYRQQPLVEIRLQIVLGLESFLLHEGLNRCTGLPSRAIYLIAANMEVRIREDLPHLPNKRIQKLVRGLLRRIELALGRLILLKLLRNSPHGPPIAQFRISVNPARSVSRDIKLRHDANTPCPRIRHDMPHLILRVELAKRRDLSEPRVNLALGAKPLVVTQMPVKDIQLGHCHAIQGAFDDADRLNVANYIEFE